MPTAIITGASAGLGRELAKIMARDGWTLGLIARNRAALEELSAELGPAAKVRAADVTDADGITAHLDALAAELGGLDCMVVNAGVAPHNRKLAWEQERTTVATNVLGFAACASWAARLFYQQRRGHLVGLSSVASLSGSAAVPAYNASKAFASRYMDGLRANLGRFGIAVTDVRPGYVRTHMTEDQPGMFWVVDAETAARGIYRAIRRRAKVAYVPRRWALIALLARLAPGRLYQKLSN
ncbi:MAG: SDR family NAD(P)-dependent oxidoreductase [Acidobacteriota bacterium]